MLIFHHNKLVYVCVMLQKYTEVIQWRESSKNNLMVSSSSPFSMSAYKEERDRVRVLKNDSVFKMIPHLPPHSPSDPSRQNTSTYLQERRDRKINDCTLNYITTYQVSAPFVCSGRRQNTTLYLHNVCSSLFRFTLLGLISCFIIITNQTAKYSLEHREVYSG